MHLVMKYGRHIYMLLMYRWSGQNDLDLYSSQYTCAQHDLLLSLCVKLCFLTMSGWELEIYVKILHVPLVCVLCGELKKIARIEKIAKCFFDDGIQ
jgi:hypothetical protein